MSVSRNQYRPKIYEHNSGFEQLLPPDGVVVESEMRRYFVFCGSGEQPNQRLVCCAMWEHWQDSEVSNLSIGSISDKLKADGWKRRKNLWICPECARPKRKRRS